MSIEIVAGQILDSREDAGFGTVESYVMHLKTRLEEVLHTIKQTPESFDQITEEMPTEFSWEWKVGTILNNLATLSLQHEDAKKGIGMAVVSVFYDLSVALEIDPEYIRTGKEKVTAGEAEALKNLLSRLGLDKDNFEAMMHDKEKKWAFLEGLVEIFKNLKKAAEKLNIAFHSLNAHHRYHQGITDQTTRPWKRQVFMMLSAA